MRSWEAVEKPLELSSEKFQVSLKYKASEKLIIKIIVTNNSLDLANTPR